MKHENMSFLQMTFHFTKCTISEQQNDSRKERPSCSFVHVADFCNPLDKMRGPYTEKYDEPHVDFQGDN